MLKLVSVVVVTALAGIVTSSASADHKDTCHGQGCDGNLGPLPVLVDSDDPPKVVGPVFPLSAGPTVMVVFTFEEQTYHLIGTPSGLQHLGGSNLVFANDTCTEPGFLDRADDIWPSIMFSAGIPTAAGTELWVQDGPATSGFLAFSRTEDRPPFECFNEGAFPRDTGDEVIPVRNTGIILEVAFPPPYDVINWPTLP